MVAVSMLISDIEGVTGSRFQESLAIVNNYANKDRGMTVGDTSSQSLVILIAHSSSDRASELLCRVPILMRACSCFKTKLWFLFVEADGGAAT